ncbi:TPA: transcriptional regulator [Pseudomonas aeruginosa]|nr:transcriptional regulator [Pseudomonas aeruginosa]
MVIATIGDGMGPHHGSALDTARLGVRSAGALFSAKCKAYAGARPAPRILHYPDSVRRLSGQSVRRKRRSNLGRALREPPGRSSAAADFRDAHRRLSG